MTTVEERWPGVELDPIMRLRILAQSLPGVASQERTLPVPFADVWHFIADLEHAIPSFDRLVESIRIIERHGWASDQYRTPGRHRSRSGWSWSRASA